MKGPYQYILSHHLPHHSTAIMVITLLSLPDESLLEIALHLDVSTVRGIAFICQRLRGIGQEALIRTATISPTRAWQLFDMLQHHPQLRHLLSHLRLGKHDSDSAYDYVATFNNEQARTTTSLLLQSCNSVIDRSALTNKGFATCCDTIRAANPLLENWKWMFAIRTERDFSSVRISLLVALASNLTQLTLHMSCIGSSTLSRSGFPCNSDAPLTEWHDQVAAVLEARLETLIISDLRPELSTPMIDLSRFHRLEHLTITLNKIKPRRREESQLTSMKAIAMLPKSLRSLRICANPWNLSIDYIGELSEDRESFPHLQLMELYFQQNLFSTAYALADSLSDGLDEEFYLAALKKAPFPTKTLVGTLQVDPGQRGLDNRDKIDYSG